MKSSSPRPKFLIGNLLLALALGMLFFMGSLSERLGIWAVALWMVLAAVGMYFVMSEKGEPTDPD